jgi:hypothetical protein
MARACRPDSTYVMSVKSSQGSGRELAGPRYRLSTSSKSDPISEMSGVLPGVALVVSEPF